MEKLDPRTDGASTDIVGQNISKLKELFPDIFTGEKVDFDALRETLGDYIDDRQERYSFTWNGKNRARQIAQTPSAGTLRPCPEESINWDSTKNIFIEGDNLEVLKLLQKAYHRQIQMIYIDPPYNTGGEFIYPDKFKDNLNTYLRYTGQTDKNGLILSTNREESGRYHTNWLNMMFPRLRISRNLLKDNGFLCISIDENEGAHLRLLLDELFGPENFVASFVWRKASGNNDSEISYVHDQVLVYRKSSEAIVGKLPQSEAHLSSYKNLDDDNRGPWTSSDYTSKWSKKERPNLWYPIANPFNKKDCYPPEGRTWAYSKEETKKNI